MISPEQGQWPFMCAGPNPSLASLKATPTPAALRTSVITMLKWNNARVVMTLTQASRHEGRRATISAFGPHLQSDLIWTDRAKPHKKDEQLRQGLKISGRGASGPISTLVAAAASEDRRDHLAGLCAIPTEGGGRPALELWQQRAYPLPNYPRHTLPPAFGGTAPGPASRCSERRFAWLAECLIQISDQIVFVLETDRKSQQILCHRGMYAFDRCAMLYQALSTAETGRIRKQPYSSGYITSPRLLTSTKRDHGARKPHLP